MGPDFEARIARLTQRLGPQLIVQVRERDLSDAALLRCTERVARVCAASGSAVIVNRRLDIAVALGVGVHLPESGLSVGDALALIGPEALVSISRHHVADLRTTAGASAVTLAPVFDTPGKGPPLGLAAVAEAAAVAPIFALGGVGAGDVEALRNAGAAGVAAIRAAWRDDTWAALAHAVSAPAF